MVKQPDPTLTTDNVYSALKSAGKPITEWGRAIDGTPMLGAKTGGDKLPAIFITAGAHCTETAGVHSALNLLGLLDTDHEVHVLPLRDPLGFGGVDRCLSFASGQSVSVPDTDACLAYLKAHADLLWHGDEAHLFKLGDLGFMWDIARPGLDTFWRQFNLMAHLNDNEPDVIRPLRGHSVMLVNVNSDIEGSGAMQRCYHTIVDNSGQWLHLNRYLGQEDAPPEVATVNRIMQTVKPGLTCDLHEGNGTGFWMPLTRPEENPGRVVEMTRAYFDYIRSRNYPITSYEEWRETDQTNASDSDWLLPAPELEGLFWLNALLKNEGHNLITYSHLFGVAYGTEAPMVQPLAMRTDGITNGIHAAIKVWEETVPG
jgi:hypothetical protein